MFIPAERMKNGVEQLFLLSDQTIEAIVAILSPEREQVFPLPYVYRNAAVRKGLRAILKRAGLPNGPKDLFHKLRRTCASHIAKAASIEAAVKQLGHLDQDVWQRYVDPRFLSDHTGAKHLPRLAWEPCTIEIEEVEPPKPAGPPPCKRLLVVRTAFDATMRDGGRAAESIAALVDELRKSGTVTGEQMRRIVDAMKLSPKDLAHVMQINQRTMWAMLSGRRPISRRIRRYFRWAIGLTYTRDHEPWRESPEAMTPLPCTAAVAAILSRERLSAADVRDMADYLDSLDAQHVQRRMRACGYGACFVRARATRNKGLGPRFVSKLRAAFGLDGQKGGAS